LRALALRQQVLQAPDLGAEVSVALLRERDRSGQTAKLGLRRGRIVLFLLRASAGCRDPEGAAPAHRVVRRLALLLPRWRRSVRRCRARLIADDTVPRFSSAARVRRSSISERAVAVGEVVLRAAEIRLDCGAGVVGVGQCELEARDLPAQRFDFRQRF
jgi:hypothetical protein